MMQVFILVMDKPMHLKKGFTLIEALFVLSILLVLMIFSSPNQQKVKSLDCLEVESYLYYKQSEAMVSKQTQALDYNHLTFNENGNINHASTIHFEKFNCIIQLGAGRFYFEKRV